MKDEGTTEALLSNWEGEEMKVVVFGKTIDGDYPVQISVDSNKKEDRDVLENQVRLLLGDLDKIPYETGSIKSIKKKHIKGNHFTLSEMIYEDNIGGTEHTMTVSWRGKRLGSWYVSTSPTPLGCGRGDELVRIIVNDIMKYEEALSGPAMFLKTIKGLEVVDSVY